MNNELEAKLVERWPKWFHVNGDKRKTLMSYGFECADGWFDLIWKLCEELEPLVQMDENFEVVQVKEKFGGLRFYIARGDWRGDSTIDWDAVHKAINDAEHVSFVTCEYCGKPGRAR
jgi:hypothetical protein